MFKMKIDVFKNVGWLDNNNLFRKIGFFFVVGLLVIGGWVEDGEKFVKYYKKGNVDFLLLW